MEGLHIETDEALDRIISVMISEYCKDSLSELIDMPFVIFQQLEMSIYIAMLRQEERNFNQSQLQRQ